MLTQNEISMVNLSPTKKDFYQIWSELIETASKISERWDPTSTNESDPGIVLLKVLTGVADKLNYNIDKNILEAFMPSAAQMESVRKLCDILGYNIGYYRSATTNVTISYKGKDPLPEGGLPIPMFTAITNIDKDVSYVTTNERVISITNELPVREISCIEGQAVQCENDNNNIITIDQIDDNRRYYLPEVQVAENGIFVYNKNTSYNNISWERVNNLNTQVNGSRVFTFGFDSNEARPYIQFPQDIGQLIDNGLVIYYIRTKGVNGNISPKTLTTIEIPDDPYGKWADFTQSDKVIATNLSAATNGHDIETIPEAYKNFKRTIGTFNTLVTCRDYMNKIYNLMDENDVNLVSNIIVSDIRNDINNSITLCSFDEQGIIYSERPIMELKPNGEIEPRINNFDLVVYPFATYRNNDTKEDFVNSFKYTNERLLEIKQGISKNKTISHTFKTPRKGDIVCIKNYLKLTANITTTTKVNIIEEAEILQNVRKNLYKKFNMRELEFGESIPVDNIIRCISEADHKIKNISLNDPVLYTVFCTADGNEYDLASVSTDGTLYRGRELYNRLLLRNILAGRLALFNYESTFVNNYSEKNYAYGNYLPQYPETDRKAIYSMKASCEFPFKDGSTEIAETILEPNEVIKFRAPNLATSLTYPAYINYFYCGGSSTTTVKAKEAKVKKVRAFLGTDKTKWEVLMNGDPTKGFAGAAATLPSYIIQVDTTEDAFKKGLAIGGGLFTKSDNKYVYDNAAFSTSKTYYYFPLNSVTFDVWQDFIILYSPTNSGIWKSLGRTNASVGYLVDLEQNKYKECSYFTAVTNPEQTLDYYFVLLDTGQNAEYNVILPNSDYELGPDEYLLINYVPSPEADATAEKPAPINIKYGPGTIIRVTGFELKDSRAEQTFDRRIWSKTSGYDFSKEGLTRTDVPGMFTLKVSEQIEIRELVDIKLKDQTMFLYWTFKDDIAKNSHYTLKDGEYLFYTDVSKTDVAYYGSGTEIITHEIKLKGNKTEEVSIAAIEANGFDAIPWKPMHFEWGTAEKNRVYVQLVEYQYVTLTAGDMIKHLDLAIDEATRATKTGLTEEWIPCNNDLTNRVKYLLGGVNRELPIIKMNRNVNNQASPLLWEVSSSLEFNMGPGITQTLSDRDQIKLIFVPVDETGTPDLSKIGTEHEEDNSQILKNELGDNGTYHKLSLKANSNVVTSDSKIVTLLELIQADGQTIYDTSFKIKLFEDTPIINHSLKEGGSREETPIIISPSEKWASISLQGDNATTDNPAFFNLNINLPSKNHYGLALFYYSKPVQDDQDDTRVYLQFETAPDVLANVAIFNKYDADGNKSWWDDVALLSPEDPEKKHYLREGINIVRFDKSGVLKVAATGKNALGVITMSTLDIIKVNGTPENNDDGINLDLLGYHVDKKEEGADEDWDNLSKRSAALLKSIRDIDTDYKFYYNTTLDGSTAIELSAGLNNETGKPEFSSPYLLYDYNNINNHFVISEIDANYLADGIKIAKDSKTNY